MTGLRFVLVFVFALLTCSVYADDFNLGGAVWKTFSTNDVKKTHGLTIQVDFPNTWNATEGKHPRVIKKWVTSTPGGAFAMLAIQMDALTWIQKTLMSEKSLSDMVDNMMVSSDALKMTVISKTKTIIEREPAFIVLSKTTSQRLLMTTTSYNYSLFLSYQGKLIHLVGAVVDTREIDNPSETVAKEFLPVFLKFANSLVLPDKWQK